MTSSLPKGGTTPARHITGSGIAKKKEPDQKITTSKLSKKIRSIGKRTMARIEKQLTEKPKLQLTGEIEQTKLDLKTMREELNILKQKRGKGRPLKPSKAEKFNSLTAQIRDIEGKLKVFEKQAESLGNKTVEEARKFEDQITGQLATETGEHPSPPSINAGILSYSTLSEMYESAEGTTKENLQGMLSANYTLLSEAIQQVPVEKGREAILERLDGAVPTDLQDKLAQETKEKVNLAENHSIKHAKQVEEGIAKSLHLGDTKKPNLQEFRRALGDFKILGDLYSQEKDAGVKEELQKRIYDNYLCILKAAEHSKATASSLKYSLPKELQGGRLEPKPLEFGAEVNKANTNFKDAKKNPKKSGNEIQKALDSYKEIYRMYNKAAAGSETKDEIAGKLRELFTTLSGATKFLKLSYKELQLFNRAKRAPEKYGEKGTRVKLRHKVLEDLRDDAVFKTPPGYVEKAHPGAKKLYKAEKGKATKVKLSFLDRLKNKQGQKVAKEIKMIGKNILRMGSEIRAERRAIETKTPAARKRESRVAQIGKQIATQRVAIQKAMAAAENPKLKSIKGKLVNALKKEAQQVQLLVQEKVFLESLGDTHYRKGAEFTNKIDHAINLARMRPKAAASWMTVAIEGGMAGLKDMIKKANKADHPDIAKRLEAKRDYAQSMIDGAKDLMKLTSREQELKDKVSKLFKGDLRGKMLKLSSSEALALGRVLAKEMISLNYLQGKELLEKTSDIEGMLAQINHIDRDIKDRILSYGALEPGKDESGNERPGLLSQYEKRFRNQEMQDYHVGRAQINDRLRKASENPELAGVYSLEIRMIAQELQDNLIQEQQNLDSEAAEIMNKADKLLEDSATAAKAKKKDEAIALKMEGESLKMKATTIRQRTKSLGQSVSYLFGQIRPKQENMLKLERGAKDALKRLAKKKAPKEKAVKYLGVAITKQFAKATAGEVIDAGEMKKFLRTIKELKPLDPSVAKEVLKEFQLNKMIIAVITKELNRATSMDPEEYNNHLETVLKPLKSLADANAIPVDVPNEFLEVLDEDLQTRLSEAEDKEKESVLRGANEQMKLFGLKPTKELAEQISSIKKDLLKKNLNSVIDEIKRTSVNHIKFMRSVDLLLKKKILFDGLSDKDRSAFDQYREKLEPYLKSVKSFDDNINEVLAKSTAQVIRELPEYLQNNSGFSNLVKETVPLSLLTYEIGIILKGINQDKLNKTDQSLILSLPATPAQRAVNIKNMIEAFKTKVCKYSESVDEIKSAEKAFSYACEQVKGMNDSMPEPPNSKKGPQGS